MEVIVIKLSDEMYKKAKEIENEFMKNDIDEKEPKLYKIWCELHQLITKHKRNNL